MQTSVGKLSATAEESNRLLYCQVRHYATVKCKNLKAYIRHFGRHLLWFIWFLLTMQLPQSTEPQ